MIDRIEWPTFFDQLARIAKIRDELKRDEDRLKPLVRKWTKRNDNIISIFISIIHFPCHQIENIFDILTKMEGFDDKHDSF